MKIQSSEKVEQEYSVHVVGTAAPPSASPSLEGLQRGPAAEHPSITHGEDLAPTRGSWTHLESHIIVAARAGILQSPRSREVDGRVFGSPHGSYSVHLLPPALLRRVCRYSCCSRAFSAKCDKKTMMCRDARRAQREGCRANSWRHRGVSGLLSS